MKIFNLFRFVRLMNLLLMEISLRTSDQVQSNGIERQVDRQTDQKAVVLSASFF